MAEPVRRHQVLDLDDGPLTPQEEAAILARIDAAWAEGGESIPAEVVFAALDHDDED